jgi:hypothetical protein|tara:strand:- start:878 stop:1102 length:225 start_codon:yes stop_codon:yes gene_type:complete
MPNPGKYKSVGLNLEAYGKLVFIADQEDRAIGRQLSRMIDQEYNRVSLATGRQMTKIPLSPVGSGLGGYAVIED